MRSEFYDTAAILHESTLIDVSPTEYTNSKLQFKSVLLHCAWATYWKLFIISSIFVF